MSAKTRTETVTLFGAHRLNNSVNGNPRYRLHTSEGEFITQSDASVSYDIGNLMHRGELPVDHTVTLHLTRAGRVWDIVPTS